MNGQCFYDGNQQHVRTLGALCRVELLWYLAWSTSEKRVQCSGMSVLRRCSVQCLKTRMELLKHQNTNPICIRNGSMPRRRRRYSHARTTHTGVQGRQSVRWQAMRSFAPALPLFGFTSLVANCQTHNIMHCTTSIQCITATTLNKWNIQQNYNIGYSCIFLRGWNGIATTLSVQTDTLHTKPSSATSQCILSSDNHLLRTKDTIASRSKIMCTFTMFTRNMRDTIGTVC